MFPDRFKNTADIIPYFFTAWIDLECTFKGSQGFLVTSRVLLTPVPYRSMHPRNRAGSLSSC